MSQWTGDSILKVAATKKPTSLQKTMSASHGPRPEVTQPSFPLWCVKDSATVTFWSIEMVHMVHLVQMVHEMGPAVQGIIHLFELSHMTT